MNDTVAALGEADELARQHRLLDAVELLQAVHATEPDPDIARRLVDLRHAAFGELPREPGLDTWPAPHPDLFPGEDGIVETLASELTGAVLGSGITNHGCLRVSGLLDDATADATP